MLIIIIIERSENILITEISERLLFTDRKKKLLKRRKGFILIIILESK